MATMTQDRFQAVVMAALEQEVGRVIEEESAAAQKRVSDRITAIRSQIVMSVFKEFDVSRGADFLTIKIRDSRGDI